MKSVAVKWKFEVFLSSISRAILTVLMSGVALAFLDMGILNIPAYYLSLLLLMVTHNLLNFSKGTSFVIAAILAIFAHVMASFFNYVVSDGVPHDFLWHVRGPSTMAGFFTFAGVWMMLAVALSDLFIKTVFEMFQFVRK